jgi:PPK2 family polyphosphate:nucleotide phosphotransferase
MKLATLVEPGSKVRLKDIDPDDKGPFDDKKDPDVQRRREADIAALQDLQEKLYAQAKQSMLVVLQAMDTAGKDGALRHVVGPLDSRGVYVWSFKAPSTDELAHDYLWRIHQKLPRKGEMTFFNRSHYEDVLAVRALDLVPKERWSKRYDHINAFEKMLTDEGMRIVKIYLHISKDEQKRRLEARLQEPEKRYKFEGADLTMRKHWDALQEAYEDVFAKTSTKWAPWHIVPANRKWFRDICVADLLAQVLREMDPKYPVVDLDPKSIVIPD